MIGHFDTTILINNYVSLTPPNINVTPYGALTSSGLSDIFLAKYDQVGQVLWATTIQGVSSDVGLNITTDTLNNVFVTGYFSSTPLTIYDFVSAPGIPTNPINLSIYGTLTSSGSTDLFVIKYNSTGQAQWATTITGADLDIGSAIVTDSLNNVYVTGYSRSPTITINNFVAAGSPIVLAQYGDLTNVSGDSDAFIVKYNSLGQAQWATNLSGVYNDIISSISVDSADNIYIIGTFASNPVTFNDYVSVTFPTINTTPFGNLFNSSVPGTTDDAFIAKYNSSGQTQWVTRISGLSNQTGLSITVDSSDYVYVTGTYNQDATISNYTSVVLGTITLSPFAILPVVASNVPSIFIAKYDSSGQAQWSTRIGNTLLGTTPTQITTDSCNNIYVSGYYRGDTTVYNYNSVVAGTITFTTYGIIALTAPATDMAFLVKYDSTGQALWLTNIGGNSYASAQGVATDTLDNIYITGAYTDNPLPVNSFSSITPPNINTTLFGNLPFIGTNTIATFLIKYI